MALLNEFKQEVPWRRVIRNWNDTDYWYVDVSFDLYIDIPDWVIKGNVIIVICLELEPYIEIVDRIYQDLIIKKDVLPKRILLLSENYDAKEYIENVANKFHKEPISYEWISVHQCTMKWQALAQFNNIKNISPKSIKSNKSFLNFNRRWRLHRPLFVSMLLVNGLLDKGHVSLGESDSKLNWKDTFPTLINKTKNDNISELLLLYKNEIVNLPHLYLDTDDLISPRHRIDCPDIYNDIHEKLYRETFISLVSETLFFEDVGRYLSEKTFKPIIYHHPFILIAPPFSLEVLKDEGYKTFDPYIDESYDREKDPLRRMKLIIEELKRLCSFTDIEIDQFVANTKQVTDYNFMNLIKKRKFSHKRL